MAVTYRATEAPGEYIDCVCGARVGYRITRRGGSATELLRCPCCANKFVNDEWEAVPFPHIRAMHGDIVRDK